MQTFCVIRVHVHIVRRYVEWLSDVSVNVHFADARGASKAFASFFKALPPPPAAQPAPAPAAAAPSGEEVAVEAAEEAPAADAASSAGEVVGEVAAASKVAAVVVDLAALGWRVGPPLAKTKADKYGPKGLSVRLVARYATKARNTRFRHCMPHHHHHHDHFHRHEQKASSI